MNIKKRYALMWIIGLVCAAMLVYWSWLGFQAQKRYDKQRQELQKSFIGKKLVVGKDTLPIVQCSLLFNTITLSNGLKVDLTYTNTPGVLIK